MVSAEARLAKRFGKALRSLRQARRWSQAELAERIDVSVDYVSLLERGLRLPAVGLLVASARVFAVTVDAMLGEEAADEWTEEALRHLRAVPAAHRPTVLALLRCLAQEAR